MPDTESIPASRRRRSSRPSSALTGTHAAAADATADEESPLLAAVLARQSAHRFGEIEVPVTIARALERMGFTTPTEVQARAIPPLREGKDVIGQAQTGTGKTAAFGIPIVEKTDPAQGHVQALILTPTRELCVQVAEEVEQIGHFRNVRTVAIYGGSSMDKQISGLKHGAQVVIGTPGRVLDLIRRGELHLERVHTVILDEAAQRIERVK